MLVNKEEGNNTNYEKTVVYGENKLNSYCSSVSLSEALEPFSELRRSYHGSHDSIKCIDVDVEAKRVYAASWSEGVFVWDLYSHKPIAVLRHQSWVNALKCFPSLSLSRHNEQKIQTLRTVKQKCSERRRSTKTVYVLTGCEDGVLSAWDAVTFSVHARLKLSLNSITAIYIESEKIDWEVIHDAELSEEDCTSNLVELNRKCNDVLGSKQNSDDVSDVNNNNSKIDISRSRVHSDKGKLVNNDHNTGGRAYVAAMHHVFVLWVDTSLTLIHDLIHPTECLCVTLLASSVTTYLIVGQENGQLICWNSSNWEYADTLEYPGDESDVNRHCLQGNCIHEPKLDVMTGQLKEESFQYNKLRYDLYINKNNAKAHNALAEQSNASTKHRVTTKGKTLFTEGAEIKELSEESNNEYIGEKFINNHNNKACVHKSAISNGKPLRKIKEEDQHLAEEIEKLMRTKEDVSYDDRRVTCLSTSDTLVKTALCNLYSGHANGVLLIWQSPFPNMPIMLMKKMHLFPHNAWVQTLVAIPIITNTETVNHEKASTNKNATKSETAIAMKATEHVTKVKQKSKKTNKNEKNVIYSKLANGPIHISKATQNSDKRTKNVKTKEKTEAKNHKICNRNGKHSGSEIKESEYLFACSDHGAVKYLKVDNDIMSSADGPGILAYSACCWTDYKGKQQNSGSGSVETKQANLLTNVYVVMGSYDGRLERYDVTAVIDRLQKQC